MLRDQKEALEHHLTMVNLDPRFLSDTIKPLTEAGVRANPESSTKTPEEKIFIGTYQNMSLDDTMKLNAMESAFLDMEEEDVDDSKQSLESLQKVSRIRKESSSAILPCLVEDLLRDTLCVKKNENIKGKELIRSCSICNTSHFSKTEVLIKNFFSSNAKKIPTFQKEKNANDVLNIMDITMRRIVKMTKRLPGFNNISQDGKYIILKGKAENEVG